MKFFLFAACLIASTALADELNHDYQVTSIERSLKADQIAELSPATERNLFKYAVKLQTAKKQSMGSGVNTAAGIVTCAHVADGHPEFEAECDGEKASAKVASIDKKNDLALLTVNWKKPHAEAAISSESPNQSQSLTSVGRQKDGTLSTEVHSFLKLENNEYLYTNPPQEGRSGSGIFDSSGRLVGIVLGKIVDVEPYVGRAARVDDIARLTAKQSRKVAAVGSQFGFGSQSGSHSHECPKCGATWSHSAASFGSLKDHTCPKCGNAVVWEQSTKPLPAVQAKPVAIAKASNCPSGNCPITRAVRRR